MRPGGAKEKGKRLENETAKILHETFYKKFIPYKELYDLVGNKDLKPQRDTSSGTFNSSKVSSGDIELNLLEKFFPVNLECKFWKTLDLSLNQILKKKTQVLEKVYNDQASVAAEKKQFEPIIVFKANRTGIFVYLKKNVLTTVPEYYIIMKDKIIMTFDDFLTIYIEEKSNV